MALSNDQKQKEFKERKEAQNLKEMRGVYVPIKHEKALKAELRAKVKELMGEEK